MCGFMDSIDYKKESTSYKLRLELPDSISMGYIINNWITVNCLFSAKGSEKVLMLGAGSSKDYVEIVNTNPNKFKYNLYDGPILRLKYFIDNLSLTEIDSSKTIITFDKIDSLKIGGSLVLPNIYFDFDKYNLLKESYPTLDLITRYLKSNPKVQIMISGHTDNIGSNAYNEDLSTKRALSIVGYLTNQGIQKYRLQSAGYGSQFPLDSNSSEVGRQKNRRIEIKILDK
jgi:outer membrane protein OmpA-like peptidoglycan-associated protein